MSEKTYLEKLLDGAEVEWVALGEVTLPTSNIKWKETIRTYRYIDLASVDRQTNAIMKPPKSQKAMLRVAHKNSWKEMMSFLRQLVLRKCDIV